MGEADYARQGLRISCAWGTLVTDTIAVDGRLYTRIGKETKWQQSEDDPDNPAAGVSPEELLSLLREASSETVRLGEEDVRGTRTVRYRLTVDREALQLGEGPPATADVDVWIDDEGVVRRIQVEDADAFTLDFFDFGVEVDIQAPPGDQIEQPVPDFDLTKPGPCTPGAESPLKVDQVRGTLRDHGFDVEATEKGCVVGVAGIITNAPDDDRGFDELLRGPGYLTCFVLMKRNDQDRTMGIGVSEPAGTQPYFSLETSEKNLECTLFADKPNADEAERRLDRAYDELERATP